MLSGTGSRRGPPGEAAGALGAAPSPGSWPGPRTALSFWDLLSSGAGMEGRPAGRRASCETQ